MSQQFTIQSESIRDKLNSLLPSQNLGSIGVELTGSTQIVPIVDLTEVAERSSLRQDLQTAFSHNVTTAHNLTNATTTTLVNTTGYYRVFGTASGYELPSATDPVCQIRLNDGTTDKIVYALQLNTTTAQVIFGDFDFNVFLSAGDSLVANTQANGSLRIATRQIADLSGNLTNPT